jgi:hypothetical protein
MAIDVGLGPGGSGIIHKDLIGHHLSRRGHPVPRKLLELRLTIGSSIHS